MVPVAVVESAAPVRCHEALETATVMVAMVESAAPKRHHEALETATVVKYWYYSIGLWCQSRVIDIAGNMIIVMIILEGGGQNHFQVSPLAYANAPSIF